MRIDDARQSVVFFIVVARDSGKSRVISSRRTPFFAARRKSNASQTYHADGRAGESLALDAASIIANKPHRRFRQYTAHSSPGLRLSTARGRTVRRMFVCLDKRGARIFFVAKTTTGGSSRRLSSRRDSSARERETDADAPRLERRAGRRERAGAETSGGRLHRVRGARFVRCVRVTSTPSPVTTTKMVDDDVNADSDGRIDAIETDGGGLL